MAIDIADVTRRVQYTGSGTGPYNFTFNILDDDDIAVYRDDTLLVKTTDYTVTINPDGTGSITTVASQTGFDVTIIGARPYARLTDYSTGGDFFAATINDELDSIIILIQQIREELLRSVKLSSTTSITGNLTIPEPAANNLLGWNSGATALENKVAADLSLATVTAFIATLLDDASAAAARTTLGAAGTVESTAALVTALEKTIPQCGRLTLTTSLPVTTADVTGATTVYFTPYKGNVLSLYDGDTWIPFLFAEMSQLTTDATKSPAAVANNSNYDIFVWNDAGTLRATRGPAWTSDTARGTGAGTTELEALEGRYVNKIAITNGPAAQRGLYVGTVRSDGSAQINDSMAKRHVWNNFNRKVRPMYVLEATDSWTYTTATIRQVNGSAANQLDMVVGLSEDAVSATAVASASNGTAGVEMQTMIGLDSTSAMATGCIKGHNVTQVGTVVYTTPAHLKTFVGIGRHYLAWLEYSAASGTTTWVGDAGAPPRVQSGITGELLA